MKAFFIIVALLGYGFGGLVWMSAPSAIQEIGALLIITNATMFFLAGMLAPVAKTDA